MKNRGKMVPTKKGPKRAEKKFSREGEGKVCPKGKELMNIRKPREKT